ncbi:hypothetical protein SS1G_00414 [Sclerotinia sclerotiorum 1980 UF-70]|uniref:Uncharacterized protein n=2 Tax=Sclerotinia sclerotiorum (strain ATCC 18683 / 1980 / Ss-1) TaxID=665079 RepID=A7E542_SCLS1|nr:hypothetical protein SS1G_00414 [Sclerotinia sclerotiorum 1980 UF-70]APA07963.1 hypothetical protein sscle_03g027330 [Sclerotinia sclerotiorum 1980 UF-70]EDN91014.1 hypothetical protein SS1G_00414 [Sclerotinia sclerotiorum 1980 UF-70]
MSAALLAVLFDGRMSMKLGHFSVYQHYLRIKAIGHFQSATLLLCASQNAMITKLHLNITGMPRRSNCLWLHPFAGLQRLLPRLLRPSSYLSHSKRYPLQNLFLQPSHNNRVSGRSSRISWTDYLAH